MFFYSHLCEVELPWKGSSHTCPPRQGALPQGSTGHQRPVSCIAWCVWSNFMSTFWALSLGAMYSPSLSVWSCEFGHSAPLPTVNFGLHFCSLAALLAVGWGKRKTAELSLSLMKARWEEEDGMEWSSWVNFSPSLIPSGYFISSAQLSLPTPIVSEFREPSSHPAEAL